MENLESIVKKYPETLEVLAAVQVCVRAVLAGRYCVFMTAHHAVNLPLPDPGSPGLQIEVTIPLHIVLVWAV